MMLLIIFANLAFAQFQYIFPKDNSRNNFPNTHLILRNGELMDESSVTSDIIELTGSQSGIVAASVVLSTDGKTICIAPATTFTYGETVMVNVKDGMKTLSGQILTGTSFDFSVRKKMTEAQQQQLEEYLNTHDDGGYLLNDPNQQSIHVPHNESSIRDGAFNFITLYTNNNPAPGELFFHRSSGSSPTASSGIGYGIMTSSADSIFYRASTTDGANFRLNLNGYLTAFRLSPGVDSGIIVLDSGYNEIDV
ncbi:MAG: Ig-like domain-containing protein, partial [Chitinophagales bacterium]|nr:Ig-like domain-containing protein [Chitinophagales bacterium]